MIVIRYMQKLVKRIYVNNYLTTTQLKGIIKSIPVLNREINVCKRYIVAVRQYDTFPIRYRMDFTTIWVAKCKFVPTISEKYGCL